MSFDPKEEEERKAQLALAIAEKEERLRKAKMYEIEQVWTYHFPTFVRLCYAHISLTFTQRPSAWKLCSLPLTLPTRE